MPVPVPVPVAGAWAGRRVPGARAAPASARRGKRDGGAPAGGGLEDRAVRKQVDADRGQALGEPRTRRVAVAQVDGDDRRGVGQGSARAEP
ncbi:hypothetical protein BL253_19460 [Pseudofrankia asymbiotica]|uniref:Uncharacterized protein n=1 Tax=Pseudofrankia asymbiotica TaxID=1834516 RepID=A0A1V2I875_9ACTN|nr:hypothetical protein BL253_19460 [Pseudofrankia asymbiotica]